MSASQGLRLAVSTLSVFPAHVSGFDRRTAGAAMAFAPLVGVLLGGIAAMVLAGAQWAAGPGPLACVLAVGALAVLTRGLHLDGLADLADGFGSARPADAALEIMRRSDIGPFGVATLILTILLQVTALAGLGGDAPLALAAACVTGRLALTWACREGVPPARPQGLGAAVAGTVGRGTALAVTAAVLTAAALAGLIGLTTPGAPGGQSAADGQLPLALGGVGQVAVLPLAVLAGLGAAWWLRRRAVRRLGGVTGDVLGALVETATTAALVTCAVLL
ncbi:hypothetical protein Misp01_56990 [Microtetraspora sp. NBRC 13810]|uniref:adenosylcobinamide-GDP ribazoletransferase n=1 Tax=Microtetraspora sp. NBRC 13810 TaxID=3030990 RepID=UPI0024A274D0|nr:adenosylcobinamide-GDP ribazoletransferase [Microtetraspora sp. NBRC 13810]GLW10571.1 hypothetical protein Misp01_56990 [Microtetraspora sp. NBRC 13810]